MPKLILWKVSYSDTYVLPFDALMNVLNLQRVEVKGYGSDRKIYRSDRGRCEFEVIDEADVLPPEVVIASPPAAPAAAAAVAAPALSIVKPAKPAVIEQASDITTDLVHETWGRDGDGVVA